MNSIDFGKIFIISDSLSSPFTDLIRLTKDFWISQIIAPKDFVGEKIIAIDIRCILLQRTTNSFLLVPIKT